MGKSGSHHDGMVKDTERWHTNIELKETKELATGGVQAAHSMQKEEPRRGSKALQRVPGMSEDTPGAMVTVEG